MTLRSNLAHFPFIAILRGIRPDEIHVLGPVLYQSGFRIIEVPLNSPKPFESINALAQLLGDKALIGAGTVTQPEQVQRVRDAGGRIIISPYCDPEVINASKNLDMISVPGVATPTEAMTALREGANALKLFPAEQIKPAVVRAYRSVLPADTILIPVGGISHLNCLDYFDAGADACGLGSSLYKPGLSAAEVEKRCLLLNKG